MNSKSPLARWNGKARVAKFVVTFYLSKEIEFTEHRHGICPMHVAAE